MIDADSFAFAFGPDQIGPYLIRAVLGEGAMSVVYAAETGDGAEVALKLLRAELLATAERGPMLARFRREAEIGGQLNHPCIARVLDHGDWNGSPWLAMERVHGHDLKRAMEHRTPPPHAAGLLVARVLDALAHAHAHGVIHRDVKPANIMVGDDLVPKLTDFGIAHVTGSDLTLRDELLGSPAYMAPELLRGAMADARADVFATGVVLYALLAGRRPFTGSVAAVMQQILFEEPPPPSHADPLLPAALDAVVMTALAKDPDRRHPGAAAFAAALRAAMAGLDEEATRTGLLIFDALPAADPQAAGDVAALRALLRGLPEGVLSEKALAEAARRLASLPHAAPAEARALVLDDGLVPLAALIRAGMPAPGAMPGAARGDWMALARLFALLAGAAPQAGAGDAAAALSASLAGELLTAVTGYAGRLGGLLGEEDNPDLALLGADFLRLEVLLLALDTLAEGPGAEGGAADAARRTARRLLRGFAAQVMRRVNATIAAFLAEGAEGADGSDGVARFGVAVLLGEVETLLDLAGHLVEGGDEVAAFVGLAGDLARHTAGELRGQRDAAAFAGRLKALAALYAFATRLRPDEALRAAVKALTQDLHGLVAGLLDAAATAPAEDADAPARIEAVYDMAERLGWSEMQRAAMSALRHRLALSARR